MKRILWLMLAVCSCGSLQAQELKATVSVTHTKVQGVSPKLYKSLKRSLTEFLNNRKWTDDHYKDFEKIRCSFLLNITKKTKQENTFDAILTIQATRPVYNTDYQSPIVNFQDKEVTFKYNQSQTLDFNEHNISGSNPLEANLTAVLAYYVYYILGLDYDSFSPDGGTKYFRKAENIVNHAPQKGNSIKGWQAQGSRHNRYYLITEILKPKYKTFRKDWYTYHRKGLDLMTLKPKEAIQNILESVSTLKTIHEESTNLIILTFYFDTKSGEWINLLRQAPKAERKKYADQLAAIDVTNAQKYNKIK